MINDRRRFLRLTAGMLATGALSKAPFASARTSTPIKAIAFDAFPVFDPRSIFDLVNQLYPQKGKEFSRLWRSRIFEYTWLLTAAGRYEDFWSCIEQALLYTTRQLNIQLSSGNHQKLMNAFLTIKAYPDVKPVLADLKSAGIKLAFLSNMTEKMLHTAIHNSSLDGMFDEVLSTDRVRTFKPDPRAYQMAIDKFNLRRDEIAFTAFASWDAIGAKWFGYPTVWINRLNFNAETLQAQPDIMGQDLSTLKAFILNKQIS